MLWMMEDSGIQKAPHHACVSVFIEFLCNDFQKIGNFHYILTTPKEAGVGGVYPPPSPQLRICTLRL